MNEDIGDIKSLEVHNESKQILKGID
jgi:hypothetical protein